MQEEALGVLDPAGWGIGDQGEPLVCLGDRNALGGPGPPGCGTRGPLKAQHCKVSYHVEGDTGCPGSSAFLIQGLGGCH